MIKITYNVLNLFVPIIKKINVRPGVMKWLRHQNAKRKPIQVIDGFKYKFDFRDSLASIKGDYESEERHFFRKVITKKDIVVDGGANMGFHSVLFSSLAKKVFAFEPIEECYKLCNENLRLNNLNAIVITKALSNKNELVKLYSYELSNGLTSKYPSVSDRGFSYDSQYVNSITLDKFFERKEPPTFIKLDIEGMEKEALEGSKSILLMHKPKLFLEIHPAFVNVNDFINFVKHYGYDEPFKVGKHNYFFERVNKDC